MTVHLCVLGGRSLSLVAGRALGHAAQIALEGVELGISPWHERGCHLLSCMPICVAGVASMGRPRAGVGWGAGRGRRVDSRHGRTHITGGSGVRNGEKLTIGVESRFAAPI